MLSKNFRIFIGISMLAISLVGCSVESKKDYSDAGSDLSSAAKETGQAIRADVGQAEESAKKALASDKKSIEIRDGMMSHKDLQITNLNVDTKDGTVVLHGNIPSEVLNQRAEQIARQLVGPDYTVDDKLSVAGN